MATSERFRGLPTLLVGLILLVAYAAEAATHRYANSWAVEVRGGPEVAEKLARKHKFINHGQVSLLIRRFGTLQNSECTCTNGSILVTISHGRMGVASFFCSFARLPCRSVI